jgi:hypothetical protein
MSEGSFTSNENDGSFLFTLASLEGFGERYPYQMLMQVIVQQQLNSMLILHN